MLFHIDGAFATRDIRIESGEDQVAGLAARH